MNVRREDVEFPETFCGRCGLPFLQKDVDDDLCDECQEEPKAYLIRVCTDWWISANSENEAKDTYMTLLREGRLWGKERLECPAIRDINELFWRGHSI